MRIAAISSKKFGDIYEGSLKNNYLYQGAYSELDDDIGWHDFMLRNYDAQIGRWVQQDPYEEFPTPYTYVGNDPINLSDPTGGLSWPPPGMNLIQMVSEASGVGSKVLEKTGLFATAAGLLSKAGTFLNLMNGAFDLLSNGALSRQVGASSGTPRMRRANRWAKSEFGESGKIVYGNDGNVYLNYADEEADDVTIVSQLIEDGEDFLQQFSTWNRTKRIGNFILDVVPLVGDIKGGVESLFDKNLLGDDLSGLDRALGFTPFLGKFKKVGKLRKFRKVLNASDGIQKYSKSRLMLKRLKNAAKTESNIAVQFGKNENQIYHAFRHTDALKLDRFLVQSTIQNHFKTVSSQVVAGKPFNQIIVIGGHRIQYTAFKLPDGTFNIGRIHGVK